MTKKLFWFEFQVTVFYVINSDKQGLIHHIHCFGCIFFHQSMKRNFVDFIGSCSMIFTLDFIHGMPQTFLIQENIFAFTMNYCYNTILIHTLCFLCPLLSSIKTNTYLGSIYQIPVPSLISWNTNLEFGVCTSILHLNLKYTHSGICWFVEF